MTSPGTSPSRTSTSPLRRVPRIALRQDGLFRNKHGVLALGQCQLDAGEQTWAQLAVVVGDLSTNDNGSSGRVDQRIQGPYLAHKCLIGIGVDGERDLLALRHRGQEQLGYSKIDL
jgi:hypothetical protein